jgi:solute carrier family 25 citrate transporter 1
MWPFSRNSNADAAATTTTTPASSSPSSPKLAVDSKPALPALSTSNEPARASVDTNDKTATATAAVTKKKKVSPLQHLLAGGTAGFVESSICHPLDTIKTRMQLRKQTTMTSRALGASSSSSSSSMKDATQTIRVGGKASSTTLAGTNAGMGGNNMEPKGYKNRIIVSTSTSTPTSNNFSTYRASIPTRMAPGSLRDATVSAATTAIPVTNNGVPATTVTGGLGPFGTAKRIIQREGIVALYKGLTAVYTGIIPKMAIRFVSFEYYKEVLGPVWQSLAGTTTDGASSSSTTTAPTTTTPATSQSVTFIAGLLSGLTEAVVVVTPAEVCKIRMQSQYHSMMDPAQRAHAKYKNVIQTAFLIVKEEGFSALYKGVVPTMLRQGCNQAVNFTVYNWSKQFFLDYRQRTEPGLKQLDHWQTLVLGGLSGGMGPLANNPLDVVKTRMQKQVVIPGKVPKYNGLLSSCIVIAKEEGTAALWKGITPRLMRIMPGQAITFMTYEAVTEQIEHYGLFD